jgi:hypothetical protein
VPRGADRRAPGTLADLERRVREAVTRGAPDLDAFAPIAALDPAGSVRVYRDGWFSRLESILASDFPGVAAALGDDGFADLARAYLAAHPPRDPIISRVGAEFAPFVAAREGLPHRAFLADLARLEWTVTSAFDHPDAPVLDPATLKDLPPERLAGARFPLAATTAVLEVSHPVHAFLDAVKRGESPPIPGPGGPPAVLVFRSAVVVKRMDLEREALAALRTLEEGGTLADAMEAAAAAADRPVEDLAPRVTAWFGEWAWGGVFAEAKA